MATIVNSWVLKSYTYKGQLHCHSTESDGSSSPTDVVTAYKNAGYDFVCLTDHDKNTANPNVEGILFIQGNEETATEGHINGINYTSNTSGSAQSIISEINSSGGLSQINHPNWQGDHYTIAELSSIIGAKLFEVWNGYVSPNENAEDKYDAHLTNSNKKAWLTATDDCHNIATDFNKGWIMVNADELTLSAIITQIEAGNFYASNGAIISNIGLSGNTINISVPESSTIKWVGLSGSILKTTTTATSDSYTITDETKYIRIVVTRDSDSKQAWSQPIFINDFEGSLDDEYTKLLMHFDGETDGIIFNEESGKEFGITGNLYTKTDNKKFGTASGYFDGSSYLNFGNHADFNFGSGSFTIDCWLYPTSFSSIGGIFNKHIGGSYDEYYCFINTDRKINFNATVNGSTWGINLVSNTILTINTWYHLAVVRHNNSWIIYINGIADVWVDVSGTIPTSNIAFYIGASAYSSWVNYFNGCIDEFRVSKGIARWTSNFTPPTNSYPLTIPTKSSPSPVIFDSTTTENIFIVPQGVTSVQVLVVAGGGGGGDRVGGGGGGGGIVYDADYTVIPNEEIVVKVGGGGGGAANGASCGMQGGNSSFGNLVSVGGGYGGGYNSKSGGNGGSGGGGCGYSGGTGGLAIDIDPPKLVYQGYNGGAYTADFGAGGGGGAGEVGENGKSSNLGGSGGDGLDFSAIFGTDVGDDGWFAGGGGGSGYQYDTATFGGKGGGGVGGLRGTSPQSGLPNTGGGGGARERYGTAGHGGSGVVIVKYYKVVIATNRKFVQFI